MPNKKLASILKDTKGFVDYRNSVYLRTNIWPISKSAQIRILLYFFRYNINGYRDLLYYRLGNTFISRILKRFFKPTSNLVLDIGEIAEGGCMFHHAFSSYINAEYVGYQCSFRNNITIGNKVVNGQLVRPYIEDRVFFGPNCVVIGKVRIGKDSIIGAGSVVTKDVPPNSVVAGNPAKIIKYRETEGL